MLGPAGLSSDSGLGGSTDGSTDILVFGSVVDSVTEEGMCACYYSDVITLCYIYFYWVLDFICFVLKTHILMSKVETSS